MIDFICRWILKKYNKNQTCYCWCPKCGLELCNSESWYADPKSDLVRYRCIQCGHESAWLFDAPTPILIEGRIK